MELLVALKAFVTWLAQWWAIIILIQVIYLWSPLNRDDSDQKGWFGDRSRVEVITDYKTGLQYISPAKGGITPRLDLDGRQMVKRDVSN